MPILFNTGLLITIAIACITIICGVIHGIRTKNFDYVKAASIGMILPVSLAIILFLIFNV